MRTTVTTQEELDAAVERAAQVIARDCQVCSGGLVVPTGVRDAGFTSDARSDEGRAARLAYLSSVVGQDVESTSELTRDQASRCIDALRADATDRATTTGATE